MDGEEEGEGGGEGQVKGREGEEGGEGQVKGREGERRMK